MSSPRLSFRFGDTVVRRRADVRDTEATSLLTPTSTFNDILATRDVSSIIRLSDELRGGLPRFTPPTQRDIEHAKRSIERALLRGELVGLHRRLRSTGGASSGSVTAVAHAPPGDASAEAPVYFPPAEMALTWFEVTFVNELGQPLPSLDLTFSLAGRTRRIATDARGTVRVDDVEGSVAFVQLADWRGVRDALLSLAASAAPVAIAGAVAHEVRADMAAVQIYSELPSVVMLRARDELWVGIELLDNHDRPVAGAEYRLTPSTGAVITGRLDAMGRARVVVKDGGPYTVTFPEYDASVTSAGSRAETPS
jgi:hypothetical protein